MLQLLCCKTTVRFGSSRYHDETLTNYQLVVLTKLVHAVGGLYMYDHAQSYYQKRLMLILICTLSWETVFSAGFELNVLRGKQPYRWTIWVSHCAP